MTTFDEASFTTMPPAARTILTHEKNGVIDVAEPQAQFAEIVARYPRP
ncbi:MAG: hypothetical protein IT181_11025, partial [Acidobacteria bacterium]|nr:hypothetical protein [Acidobacteriota bacterium]